MTSKDYTTHSIACANGYCHSAVGRGAVPSLESPSRFLFHIKTFAIVNTKNRLQGKKNMRENQWKGRTKPMEIEEKTMELDGKPKETEGTLVENEGKPAETAGNQWKMRRTKLNM